MADRAAGAVTQALSIRWLCRCSLAQAEGRLAKLDVRICQGEPEIGQPNRLQSMPCLMVEVVGSAAQLEYDRQ